MQLAAEYNALVQQIVAEHPGYIWNPQTASLMKAPEPQADPAQNPMLNNNVTAPAKK